MRTILVSVILSACFMANTVQADQQVILAPVERVVAIERRVQYMENKNVCNMVNVPITTTVPMYTSPQQRGNPLVGALVGAALGHAVRNDRRGVMTGATLGIAYSLNQRRQQQPAQIVGYQQQTTMRQQQSCYVQQTPRHRTEVVGYDVTYRHEGNQRHIIMEYRPTDHVRVVTETKVY
jgi:uncharacterized protein YcfJ